MPETTDILSLVARIECEYREMPGLQLTESQMQRMWRLDGATCEVVITVLVTQGIVVKTPRNAYARADRRDNSAAA
jgi:hypothetical protein